MTKPIKSGIAIIRRGQKTKRAISIVIIIEKMPPHFHQTIKNLLILSQIPFSSLSLSYYCYIAIRLIIFCYHIVIILTFCKFFLSNISFVKYKLKNVKTEYIRVIEVMNKRISSK